MNFSNPFKIGILENNPVYREGLFHLFEQSEIFSVSFDWKGINDFSAQMANAEIDILLLDLCDPAFDGRVLFEMVRTRFPGLKVIIISSCPEPPQVVELIKEGVCGILLKDSEVSKILQVIKEVHVKGHYYDDTIGEALALHILSEQDEEAVKLAKTLTRRESEIQKLLEQQKTNREISEELFISFRTVENHRLSISKKILKHL